jgi:hypothetical protein
MDYIPQITVLAKPAPALALVGGAARSGGVTDKKRRLAGAFLEPFRAKCVAVRVKKSVKHKIRASVLIQSEPKRLQAEQVGA